MKIIITALTLCATLVFAEKNTIDLAAYENSKNFITAKASYAIGTHTYTLVNIKPLGKGDTACISAVKIDKRKFVLFDIGVERGAFGLFVPPSQPLKDGFIVLKASPDQGKTFLFLPSGKLVTLPGAQTFVDTAGKQVYCIWEEDGKYRLTVFNYKAMRLTIPTMEIKQPVRWFASDASYCFSAPGEKGYYSVEMFTKSVVKIDRAEGTLLPVPYLMDFSKITPADCCSAKALKK